MTKQAMPKIFVSYRRDDTAAGYVLSLRNRLVQRFGKDNVFLDIDRIDYGDDFVEIVKTQLATCQACVVWIGREWMTCQDERGQRRLDNPNDLVRVEVATALQRRIVIPVLVGARAPKREDLPDNLQPLAALNAIEVRHAHFDGDLDALMEFLERRVVGTPWIIPVLITTIAWMAFGCWFGPFFAGPNLDEDLTAPLVPYLVSGAIAGVGIAFAVWRMRRDVSRVALGLLCLVWIVAWVMVAFVVGAHGVAYEHPIAVFPGGIYSVATSVGCLGGLGTGLALLSAGLLAGWKRLLSVTLSWATGCLLSAVILNWSSRYWSFHAFDTVAFTLANALAGSIAGGIGAAVTFQALYRHAAASAADAAAATSA